MNEKAWNDGSAGPPISGQTLERATGLVLPSNTPHFSSVTTYFLLNSTKPVSVNWPGERNSQAQNDVSGRPRSRMYCSTRSKPCISGTGLRNCTRSIS